MRNKEWSQPYHNCNFEKLQMKQHIKWDKPISPLSPKEKVVHPVHKAHPDRYCKSSGRFRRRSMTAALHWNVAWAPFAEKKPWLETKNERIKIVWPLCELILPTWDTHRVSYYTRQAAYLRSSTGSVVYPTDWRHSLSPPVTKFKPVAHEETSNAHHANFNIFNAGPSLLVRFNICLWDFRYFGFLPWWKPVRT